jgi:hypothetical protein
MQNGHKVFLAMLILGAFTIFGWAVLAGGLPQRVPIERAALDAASPDVSLARVARARLRAAGPVGLEALFDAHAQEVREILSGAPGEGPLPESWARVRGAIDAVARQRDAHASRLYWYTDLTEARNAARAGHRPILSLRLLGNLDDEMSCANSRYFRTALYANRAISDRLRGGWILYWESVRPAPLMTIDFGDGRRIERTVTGNSLHYILDPEGEGLDVLPGLVGPGAFLRALEQGEELAARVATSQGEDRKRLIADFHRDRIVKATLGRTAEPPIEDAVLDANSRALMRLKTRGVYGDASFERVVASFERATARDGLENERRLRPMIDAWFVNGEVGASGPLTDRIYSEVFLTPRTDPWLGLVPAETYSALDGDGRSLRDADGRARESVDGVAIPTDEEILRIGPPPTARDAGIRAGVKTMLEGPALNSIVPAIPRALRSPTPSEPVEVQVGPDTPIAAGS